MVAWICVAKVVAPVSEVENLTAFSNFWALTARSLIRGHCFCLNNGGRMVGRWQRNGKTEIVRRRLAVLGRVEGRCEGQSRRPPWGLAALGAHRKLELSTLEGRHVSSPVGSPRPAGGAGSPRAPATTKRRRWRTDGSEMVDLVQPHDPWCGHPRCTFNPRAERERCSFQRGSLKCTIRSSS